MAIRVGDCAEHRFTVSAEDMRVFQRMCGDTSLIHTDTAFAKGRGFDDVIVYGGIMLAHLSHVLGMQIPGQSGTSLRWSIDYRRPLYVGVEAVIRFEVVGVSPGTGMIDGKYRISAEDRLIATGTTQSLVPTEQLTQ